MSRVQHEPVALTSKARARKRHRRNVALATVLTAALCVAGGGVAYAATRPSGTEYRTTTAVNGDVTETVNLTGTVASAKRKDAAFETAGTVGSVAVTVGEKVVAGQTLATLKSTSLTAAVTAAKQTVVQATQTLASDLAAQSSSSTSTSGSSSSSTSSSAPSTGSGTSTGGTGGSGSGSTVSPAVTKAIAAVTAAQKALVAQYATAQASLAATEALVAASSPTCAPFLAATIADEGAAAGDGTTTTSTTPAQQLAAAQAALGDCKTAISGVLTSEQATDAAQKTLQTLAADLNTAVAALSSALGSTGSGTTAAASSATTNAPTIVLVASITNSGGSTATGTSSTITAATILADEAGITAAKAKLAIATNSASLGTLTSPIAGTVAAVAITTGSSVSAGSTSDVITIIGDSGYIVSSTVTLTGVQKLAIGDAVAITVPSSPTPLDGTVSSIGIMNVSTSSTPSYDVVVAVTEKDATLLNGASATMVVTADIARSVLTVPTSAVHRSSRIYTVNVLKDGKSVATTVKIGASGTERTQIVSGISAGAVVILANVSSTTIGDSTSTTSSSGSGLSGLSGSTSSGGTGGPPAGFTPGGAN